MYITISVNAPAAALDNDILSLEVGLDTTTADLKIAIQSDTGVSPAMQVLFYNGQELTDDSKTLGRLGVKEGDMMGMLVHNPQTSGRVRGTRRAKGASQQAQADASASSRGASGQRHEQNAEGVRLQALNDPGLMEQLKQHSPDLANAVEDSVRFQEIWNDLQKNQEEAQVAKEREVALLNDDPFNIEAQAKIEEMIREERVMENLQDAMDYNPEVFGRVHMLYIDVEVNGNQVKAFVDSGAQTTIMSPSCAEQCGIMRLVDKRYSGIARGVGTAKILGRVHSAQIKIGSLFLACSFTVMEGKDVDLLLGLDMLKRHQACIDLRKGALVVGDVEVAFLGEAEIPKHEETRADEPTIEGPGGSQVGGVSGTVIPPEAQNVPVGTKNFQGRGQNLGAASTGTSSGRSSPRPQKSSNPHDGQFPSADIAQLMDLGFSREKVLRALEMAGGNVEMAAGFLL